MTKTRDPRNGQYVPATRFEDTQLNITEAAALLKRPVSQVRTQARAGELPVERWDGDRPIFQAGAIMALAGVAPRPPAVRRAAKGEARVQGWYWVKLHEGDEPACALWEAESHTFWLHGKQVAPDDLWQEGPRTAPPEDLR